MGSANCPGVHQPDVDGRHSLSGIAVDLRSQENPATPPKPQPAVADTNYLAYD